MQQDADKRMEMVQRGYRGNSDRWIRIAQNKIGVGQDVYLDQPQMTTSDVECLANKLHSQVLSAKTDPFG